LSAAPPPGDDHGIVGTQVQGRVPAPDGARPGGPLVALDRGWQMWPLAALRTAGAAFDRLDALAVVDALEMPPGGARVDALRTSWRDGVDAVLGDDFVLRALTWQNPDMVDNWLAEYVLALRNGRRLSLSRMDRRLMMVAKYAQRYCAKNDTIGFFGPVSWARWSPGRSTCVGGFGVRRCEVFLEVWAVQGVVQAWAADPALRPLLPVWLNPACSVSCAAIRRPHRPPIPLDEASAEILRWVPRVGSLGELLARCGPAAADTVRRLEHAGVLRVGLRVPLDSRPERFVRNQLLAMPESVNRTALLAAWDRLEQALAAATTADDAQSLRRRLAEVADELRTASGKAVAPGAELAPGGRTPIYTDCRRDLDVELGEELLDGLAVPLGVLLDSARWLAGQVGETVEHELRLRYRQLRSRRASVTLADLQFASADALQQGTELLADVVADFQLRWSEILPPGSEDVQVEPAHARRLADALFPAGGTMWAAARTHSPDLMLRTNLDDGGARWVLGELHVALNTLESRVFRSQCDNDAELVSLVAATGRSGRVVPVYPNSSREVSPRTYPPLALDPPARYHYWSYGSDDGHPSGAVSTPATALLVTESGGDLIATAEDGGWSAPVLECFGEFVSALVVNLFRIRPPARYAPRVSIGDLVVCRRLWRVSAAEAGPVPRLRADPGHDRLRAWARSCGMPRHVFVRTRAETKPFYVDFSAPLLVENLARAMRGAAGDGWIEVAEMLPAPDELWLRGPGGERYTSELRVVAVDPVEYPAALP
jgi:hypothetical protein